MKKGWQYKKLVEVCDIKHGYAFDGTDFDNDYYGNNPIVLTPGNFSENATLLFNEKNTKRCTGNYPKEYEFNIGDLVVVMTDLSSKMKILGKPAMIETENILHNQRIGKFIFFDKTINKKYLFYLLLTDTYLKSIKETATGTMVRHTAPKRILDFKIPIPPLPVQQEIVSILDQAFAVIEQAKENVQRNLQNAKELFKSELNDIFTRKGKGWLEKNLLEVCSLKSGTTFSPELETPTGDTAYLKVADMNFAGNENRVGTSSRFVNKNEINENNIFPIGTIIFPKRGGAIATNKKRITDIPICADLNIMGAIANQSMYSEFLFYYFKKFNLLDIANGTTILQINNYSFEPMKISFPKSLEEQKKIVSQLDTLSTETKNLENIYQKKLDALEELKKSILQKAFSGELKTTPTSIPA